MELSLLIVLLSIASSAVSARPTASHNSHHHRQELTSNEQQQLAVAAYLSQSARDVQLYRKEIRRELDLLVQVMSATPSMGSHQLAAALVERVANAYEQLDQSIDFFLPDEIDMTTTTLDETDDFDVDDSDNESSGRAKRNWPKRMYSAAAKYNKIPVIRTGK